MNADRLPLFCSTAMAERIERAEAEFIAKASEAARRRRADDAGFVLPIAGGVASFAEEGSPFNKVAGLGFGGAPSADALDAVERAFAARGTPTQIELAHLGDPALGTCLGERGYRLVSFENVLGLALGGAPALAAPTGIDVQRSDDDELAAWLDVVTEGVAHPDTQGVPSHEAFVREIVARALCDLAATGSVRYVARRSGVVAGGASLRMSSGIAQFGGAATAPAHRRWGVQTALLSARLADATAAGCDVAVIVTQPGSKSQENAQRRGFELLYTRAVWVKNELSSGAP